MYEERGITGHRTGNIDADPILTPSPGVLRPQIQGVIVSILIVIRHVNPVTV